MPSPLNSIKCFKYAVSLLILIPFFGFSTDPKAPRVVFKRVANALASIKKVSYHYSREFSYPAESYHSNFSGEMYIDFNSDNDLVGFRYQFKHSKGFSIFNNTEIFDGLDKSNTIRFKNKLTTNSFDGESSLYGSLITLRNILPLIISDNRIVKSVSDTLMDDQRFYVLSFDTHNSLPDYLGTGFSKVTAELTFHHRLLVNKDTYLPFRFLQTKYGSEDLNRTDFTNINLYPQAPNENSWYYSSYLDQYKKEVKVPTALIREGSQAPGFMLQHFKSGEKIGMGNYRGKLLLMEFWIKNCGYCIAAVDKLNAIQKKYKAEQLSIVAINTEDNESMVNSFISSHRVNYPVLWGKDSDVNTKYGISGFPTVVIVNREGLVIYAGDLDEKKIIALINQNL